MATFEIENICRRHNNSTYVIGKINNHQCRPGNQILIKIIDQKETEYDINIGNIRGNRFEPNVLTDIRSNHFYFRMRNRSPNLPGSDGVLTDMKFSLSIKDGDNVLYNGEISIGKEDGLLHRKEDICPWDKMFKFDRYKPSKLANKNKSKEQDSDEDDPVVQMIEALPSSSSHSSSSSSINVNKPWETFFSQFYLYFTNEEMEALASNALEMQARNMKEMTDFFLVMLNDKLRELKDKRIKEGVETIEKQSKIAMQEFDLQDREKKIIERETRMEKLTGELKALQECQEKQKRAIDTLSELAEPSKRQKT